MIDNCWKRRYPYEEIKDKEARGHCEWNLLWWSEH